MNAASRDGTGGWDETCRWSRGHGGARWTSAPKTPKTPNTPGAPNTPNEPASRKLANLAPERSLRRLELKVTRRLDGLLNGEHMGLLPGPGTELAEARVYQPGEDDVRHMDWAVTARTTIPHVRDLIADHELEAWALVDLSASMDFGTAELEKRDLAVAALAAVGFLTVRLGDRVGAYILHRGALRRWPARTGKAALYAMLQSILDADRSPPQQHTGPNLADAITNLARGQTRRGLRVIISDFLDSGPSPAFPTPATTPATTPAAEPAAEPSWERPLRRLVARHQVLAVEVIDTRELDLPDVGLVEMTDPETGAVHEIVLSPRVRAAYAQAAAAQRARNRDALRRSGAQHLVLYTDRDWIIDIARFALRQRRVVGRAAGGGA
jgi:uncharacterized protein (DUF58 family)